MARLAARGGTSARPVRGYRTAPDPSNQYIRLRARSEGQAVAPGYGHTVKVSQQCSALERSNERGWIKGRTLRCQNRREGRRLSKTLTIAPRGRLTDEAF